MKVFRRIKNQSFIISGFKGKVKNMETSGNDTHFKNIISLGTEKKLSWNTVDSILCDDMTLTFEETKQLVKVLLKELQTMQIKLEQKLFRTEEGLPAKVVEVEAS